MPTFSTPRVRALTGAVVLLAVGYLAGRLDPFATRSPGVPAAPPAVAGASAFSVPAASPSESAPAAPAPVDPRARWAGLRGLPPSAARERALADCLRELAATDPAAALVLAGGETNFRVRQALVVASLEGWAGHDPESSLAWAAENLFETNRREAVQAVIAAGLPLRDETLRAVRALCETSDPAQAADYGRMLIVALAREADFPAALDFAAAERGPNRDHWIGAALYSWSQYRPEEAAAALAVFTDPAARNEGLHGLILGWSADDPAAFLKYAETLPPGAVRSTAYDQALQNWVANDPVGASAWLDAQESAPELDTGAARLATSPFLVEHQIETALGWAHSVVDPEQRSIALIDIVQQWARRDPVAARAYAVSLSGLQPAYREQLMQELGAPAAPVPDVAP